MHFLLSLVIAAACPSPDLYGADSDNIDRLIAAACAPGADRTVTLGKNPYRADGAWMITRAILLPDDFTLVLDDCRVELAPGTRDNLLRNAGALGFRRVTPNRGIRVLGRGNAVLSGGKTNHFAPMRSGDWNGWQAMGILFSAVTDYELSGFTLEETQCWGITQENGCARGWVHDIVFNDSNKMLNQDGIDVRKGCHDIVIENISGSCGDDVVALTALRKLTGAPRTNGRSSCQIGGYDATADDDVYNIMIRNIRAKCAGGHGVIRLLAQDGVKMHHITVSNVVETVGANDLRSQATIRIGDTNYWTLKRNEMGDLHHITVRDVTSTGRVGVWVKGPLCDSEVTGIRVPADAKRYDISAATERVNFGAVAADSPSACPGWSVELETTEPGGAHNPAETPRKKALLEGFRKRPTRVTVDWNHPLGLVKPVNGVGQPPMLGGPTNFRMMHYLKEAGIPYSRLHDVGGAYGQSRYVDIPNIFRDFAADENDPKNYDFAYTDALMKALEANGVEPFFRLGVTIENPVAAGFPRRHIDPPADYAKWARVCEHVIRHYTEGWAGGYRMKVSYWELWNEADNMPDPAVNTMWHAPFSEYIRFYGTVVPYLKAKFPHLKFGAFGSCGLYAAAGSAAVRQANSSPRTEHFLACATNFLAAVRANNWPLDFFSYHSYSGPGDALAQVRCADEILTRYGFGRERTERIFDEWLTHVGHDNLGTAFQASGIAAMLVGLQNGPCDLACIYDARCNIGDYAPLFNPMTYKPHKAYYAFVAFNELRKRGKAVAVSVEGARALTASAACSMDGGAVMIVNESEKPVDIIVDFQGRRVIACHLTDETHTNAPVDLPNRMPPQSFVVVQL